MTTAFIGFGSNLGDRAENVACAMRAVGELPATSLEAVSRLYESEPWGPPDQPAYANAVARIRTTLPADVLLDAVQDIERECGREPQQVRFGPRVIDIDILLYGDEEWTSERLTIPHPRMDERQFVMIPLTEVAGDATWPDGRPICGDGWVGRVTGELGYVPGMEEITPIGPRPVCEDGSLDEPTGERAGEPQPEPGHLPADEPWEVVSVLHPGGRMDGVPDFGMHFQAMVLEQEGIPFVWDPAPPEQNYSPWGLSQTVRLRVPAGYAERAKRLLEETAAAPPEFEEP